MKTKLLLLAVLLCSTAFSGQLVDSVNFFGPRGVEVASAIADKPVWIYAVEHVSDTGIKATADELAQQHPNGFAIVLTTHPREWRISMNPIGLASSESVRMAGDVMVQQFKRGNFTEGAIAVSSKLTQLTVASPVYPAVESAHTTVPTKTIPEDNTLEYCIWIIGSVVAILAFGFFVAWLFARHEAKKERELRSKTKTRNPSDRPSASAAQNVYDSYTPSERERVIVQYRDHPSYNRSVLDDPMMFYLFMQEVQRPVYGYPSYYSPAAPVAYDPPARHYSAPDPTPSRDDSSSYSPPSSSDSSGAGSSYDSGGGSSFDSGSSSSDSSGGGGSW